MKRRTWRLSHGIAVGDEPWTVRELVNLVFLREMNRAGSVRAERRPPPWPWWRRHGPGVRGAVNGLPAAPQSVFGRIQQTWGPRGGAGRVLNSRGFATSEFSLPRPARSREWLHVALLECGSCHHVVERRSPVQRYCAECSATIKRQRSRWGMARARRHSSGQRSWGGSRLYGHLQPQVA